jgi:hypothetical protein
VNRLFVSCPRWFVACALPALLALPAEAQEPGAQQAPAHFHYGMLRVRDLTPFGFLRLDMRPAHAISGPPGNWGVELDIGYQNTWTLSRNTQNYLKSLSGRRHLGPDEVQAIRDLPGEAYLVDLELGLLDLTFHRKLTDRWGVYATVSAVSYHGGFMDAGIESFHDQFGMNDVGRPAVNRNDINVILDLKKTQLFQPELPDGGLLDPVLGVRYTANQNGAPWNLVIEGAVKVPVDGERPFLSNGHFDLGAQITLQRFLRRHAAYASLAAVHTRSPDVAPTYSDQVVPTLVLGYEYKMTDRANLNAQVYASPSVFKSADTDLQELRDPKYQVSLGVRYRVGGSVLTLAVTENVINYHNSPDIGFQVGWAYSPALARR